MNDFTLVKPVLDDEKAFTALMDGWKAFGGKINPGLLRAFDGDYPKWLKYLSKWENSIDIGEQVPQTFFFLKSADGTVLGAVSLRHYLNHTNIIDGGHVAYGIFPCFRRKGYGNLILHLALEKLSEMTINRVLITCDFDNLASQKVILNNGGILENQIFDEDGVLVNRYWVENYPL